MSTRLATHAATSPNQATEQRVATEVHIEQENRFLKVHRLMPYLENLKSLIAGTPRKQYDWNMQR